MKITKHLSDISKIFLVERMHCITRERLDQDDAPMDIRCKFLEMPWVLVTSADLLHARDVLVST
jgi:hypothetical protein